MYHWKLTCFSFVYLLTFDFISLLLCVLLCWENYLQMLHLIFDNKLSCRMLKLFYLFYIFVCNYAVEYNVYWLQTNERRSFSTTSTHVAFVSSITGKVAKKRDRSRYTDMRLIQLKTTGRSKEKESSTQSKIKQNAVNYWVSFNFAEVTTWRRTDLAETRLAETNCLCSLT